jgi:hypothetical protein
MAGRSTPKTGGSHDTMTITTHTHLTEPGLYQTGQTSL